MESKARALGHPIHPVLVVFPLGLFATSVIFDLIRLAGAGEEFSLAAFYMIGAGIVGGLVAAVFGFVDWLYIPGGTRAKRIGLLHGLGNVVVTALFAASWLIRLGDPRAFHAGALVVAVLGAGLAFVAGWLGGELVDRLGVGVHAGANLNAPSSLSGRPADATGGAPPLEPRRV